MKIDASWSAPIRLNKCRPGGLIYELDLSALPTEPGVYVFFRQYGEKIVPIYIGETLSLRGRVHGHLKSLPLMRAIENAPNGKRFLIFCKVKAGTISKARKHIKVIEKSLILHAQTEGHELYNKRGTKLPTDTIAFTGNRTSEAIAPRIMYVKRALTKPTRVNKVAG